MKRFVRSIARQLGAVALLAVLVRALVPGGYMLATAESAHGRALVVQMCDGSAMPKVGVDLETGEIVDLSKSRDSSDSKGSNSPCAFAASAPIAAPSSASEAAAPALIHMPIPLAVQSARPGMILAAPPPPATGPPTSV